MAINPEDLRSMPVYGYDTTSKSWKEQTEWNEVSSTCCSEDLKCATFNVLFDIYQNSLVQSDIRYMVQIRMLEKLQVDVLTLNEMTPPYLAKLMNEQWIQNNYYLSETETGQKKETGHSTIVPYGNLILLSRHKFTNVQFLK